MKHIQRIATVFAAVLFPIWFANAQPSISWAYDFVKLDYPGAAVSFPLGINATRQIVGVRLRISISPEQPRFPVVALSPAALINDRGDISGVYTDQKGFQHGFMRTYAPGCDESNSHCQPAFHTIDVPGAVQTQNIVFELGTGLGSAAVGINNLQDVVGLYATKGLYPAGFKLSHGSFTTGIDDPASSHSEGNGSRLFAINDLGFIAGAYQTDPIPAAPFGVSHGFMFAGGNYIPVYVPGSEQGGFGTQANGINIFLEVVGVYTDPMGTFHGMLWAGGQPFSVDYPGAPYSEVHSINAGGDLTGAYIVDLTGENYRGFVAYRKH
jgi:hypothetical protein